MMTSLPSFLVFLMYSTIYVHVCRGVVIDSQQLAPMLWEAYD